MSKSSLLRVRLRRCCETCVRSSSRTSTAAIPSFCPSTLLRVCWVLVGVALSGAFQPGIAQVSADCSHCQIRLLRELQTDTVHPRSVFAFPTPIVRDSRGRIALVDRGPSGGVMFFDSAGQFIARLDAFEGAKDERADHVTLAIGTRDSLHIFGSRHTLVDRSQRVVRSLPLPEGMFAEAAAVMTTGDAVVNASVRSRDLAGYPLHV